MQITAQKILLIMNLVWFVSLFSLGFCYFRAMLRAYRLTKNKAGILLGTWYFKLNDYETPEGKRNCMTGAACVLMLTTLIILRAFFWNSFFTTLLYF